MIFLKIYVKELITGTVLAVLTAFFLTLLPEQRALELMVILLAVIASIYVGFALSDGRKREIMIEGSAALFFLAFAVLGLWVSPLLLAAGYLLHGSWDFAHHPSGIQTRVIHWYIPLCSIYDIILAIFILIR